MKLGFAGIALISLYFAPFSFADNSTGTTAASPQKMAYKVAKEECLKQDASLKGKALRKCVHDKRQVASTK